MEASRSVKPKPIHRFLRENVRSWSELLSLCLNPSDASARLAAHCAQELFDDRGTGVSTTESCRLIRLRNVAHRNQMNWTVDASHGTQCVGRIEHALFAVDICIDQCTDQIEQVCLVDQSSRTSCSHMLECLRAEDYVQFERHLRGFVALRERGSILLEAERLLSEACKGQTAPSTSYWDLLPELGHFCPRVGGIAPRFYYFLSPKAFIQWHHGESHATAAITEMIEREGFHFSLTANGGLLRVELQPPIRCCSEVVETLPDADCDGAEVKASIERRLFIGDGNNNRAAVAIKIHKPTLKIVRSVAVPQISSIGAIIRQLRKQAFLHELLDLSELPLCSSGELASLMADGGSGGQIWQIEVSAAPDCGINVCYSATGSSFRFTKLRYDGQNVSIDDIEKGKLEFVFKKLPSLISLLRLVQGRCTERDETDRDISMNYPQTCDESEVSLNAVFNSVIERFTARSVAPPEESPEALPETDEACGPTEETLFPEEQAEEEVEPLPLITPKIKIKPILCPPEVQQSSEEVKKKRKGRKPKGELAKSDLTEESETKRVEPLRIKISSLNTTKRQRNVSESSAKKHPGRKRLAERKTRGPEEKEKQRITEIKEEKVDVNIESLSILNDDKKKSSLSHFKIPRKKAPQEIGPSPPSWETGAGPQPVRYRPQSILSEPLPPTRQYYPSMDRSSSLSPQTGPNNRALFPPAFQAAPTSPRLRQPLRQPFSPALGHPMDVRPPRYRMNRTGSAQEFRFR